MIEKSVYNMNATEYLTTLKLYNVDVPLDANTVNSIYEIYKTYCLDKVNNDENFLKLGMIVDVIAARNYDRAEDLNDIISTFGIASEDVDNLLTVNTVIALRFNLDLEQTVTDLLTALSNKKSSKSSKLIYAKAVLNYAIASPYFNNVASSIKKVIEFINTCTEGDLDAATSVLSYMINRMEA